MQIRIHLPTRNYTGRSILEIHDARTNATLDLLRRNLPHRDEWPDHFFADWRFFYRGHRTQLAREHERTIADTLINGQDVYIVPAWYLDVSDIDE